MTWASRGACQILAQRSVLIAPRTPVRRAPAAAGAWLADLAGALRRLVGGDSSSFTG
jgi:hypothetical protein